MTPALLVAVFVAGTIAFFAFSQWIGRRAGAAAAAAFDLGLCTAAIIVVVFNDYGARWSAALLGIFGGIAWMRLLKEST